MLDEFCPNCGGRIEAERLAKGGVCSSCLSILPEPATPETIMRALEEQGKLQRYTIVAELEKRLSEFRHEFWKALGYEPWSLQEVWARRVLLDENFAIVAPTGVGKTVFCAIMALYLIKHKKSRCYIILPNSILVDQVSSKCMEFAKRMGLSGEDIAFYHTGMKRKEKNQMLKKIEENDYKLLITTDRFLVDKFEFLKDRSFDYVFVDDVDSFLKSPKNIDRVVMVLGFEPDVVDKVLRLIELRRRLSYVNDRKLEHEYDMLSSHIERLKREKHGRLIVAGATLRPKTTRRVLVFSELLDFEPGTSPKFVRNIADFYLREEKLLSRTLALLKEHGRGALIFTPVARGKNFARRLTEKLVEKGVRAYFYETMEEGILERFKAGEFDALVGLSSGRSPFARGIDLPETVRYAIFVGVPRREVKIEKNEINPNKLFALLSNVIDIIDEDSKPRALQILQSLRRIVPMRRDSVDRVREALQSGKTPGGQLGYLVRVVKQATEFIQALLTPDFLKKVEESSDITIRVRDDAFYLIIPDTYGYLQASGRTSRLYAAGVSRGVSILLVDDEKTFTGLTRRLKLVLEDFDWIEYTVEEARRQFSEVDRDREVIAQIRAGQITIPRTSIAREALMIVESPTKAKTFARFFGKPYKRRVGDLTLYTTSSGGVILQIAATMGHVTDLAISPGFHGVLIDDGRFIPVFSPIKRCRRCGYQFVEENSCPSCGSKDIFSKQDIIEALRKAALSVNEVYVATDPDAEGEKIAYDITSALQPYNPNIYRLEFHEVTRKALLRALSEKRKVSENLVAAQLVRRIEDRWLGFELSRRLWERFGSRGLSAGRVQTPVLGWIVKRMEEAKKRKTVLRTVLENGLELSFESPAETQDLDKEALFVEIADIREEVRELNPYPPYITATLLRDAFAYLRFSVDMTMQIAQELFESGFITYHRTDATTVSSVGLNIAREYIQTNKLGEFIARTYAREGAHECIRPVRPLDRNKLQQYIQIGIIKPTVAITERHLRLYDLIFRRFIASQMEAAVVVSQKYKARIGAYELEVDAVVDVLHPGFNKLFPTISVSKRVEEGRYRVVDFSVKTVPAAWPYTEGDIITLMRERGIGRPSTYSKIVQVLFERGYVFANRGRIIPTKRGRAIYQYLEENYGKYVSEETTRRLEELMDMIEAGEKNYQEVLEQLRAQTEEISIKQA